MHLESEPGRGSTFSFRIPMKAAPERPRPVLPGRALIVESHPASREAVYSMLRFVGMAVDGSEPPTVRLVSVAELQDAPRSDARTIVLHRAGERFEQSAGYPRLVKPFGPAELIAILAGNAPQASAASPPEAPAEAGPPLRLLLAEDNLVNQKLMLAMLAGPQFEIQVAGNGLEAVRMFESGSFDVILMDVQMPELNGLEATARIRAQEKASGGHTPIIAMTAHAMPEDRRRCLDAGMDDYVAKPVKRRDVLDAIARVTRKARAPVG